MHLKYENQENRFVFITGFLCLLLLFAITLTDILSRSSVSSVL
jgi:caa(3)-type oxidase subunit IV